MNNYMYLVPVAAVIALLFAAYLAAKVSRQDAGTERMKEIAGAIADGARAFLTAEYKILIVFVVVLFVLIGLGVGNWVTAVCFVVGALFSTIAGYCGMTVATKANVRTANAAKESGMNKALSIAFSGGAVMGMCVAGLGALGVSLVYIVTKNVDVLFGFSLGASSIALFASQGSFSFRYPRWYTHSQGYSSDTVLVLKSSHTRRQTAYKCGEPVAGLFR